MVKFIRLYTQFIPWLLPAVALILPACSSHRLLNDNEYLLVKNSVAVTGKNPGIDTDELYSIARPKPNAKFLGISRIKLFAYNLGSRGKQNSKFRTWLRENVGERPVIFDSAAALASSREMSLYLNKVGYFNSTVSLSTAYPGKKKVKVNYLATPSAPYLVTTLEYAIDDTLVMHYIGKSREESKIRPGSIYNVFHLDDERDRITKILRNNGYYYFSRDFVYFEIDSTHGNHTMEVKVRLRPPPGLPGQSDTGAGGPLHRQYFINQVLIRPDYNPLYPNVSTRDTLKFIHQNRRPAEYLFLYADKPKIQPPTLAQSVFIKPGDPFRMTDITKTRSRLNELGLFSYTNIRFRDLAVPDTAVAGLLDCTIELSQRKLHAFTVETEATNSGGRPGIGLNFSYQNSNIFRGSELFRMKLHGALEAQQLFGDGADFTSDIPFFNTIETGLELSVTFPRFLIPLRQERFPKYFRPKTTTSFGLAYESRPEYSRWRTNFNFGYDWKESEQKRHQLFPFDWSLINVDLSPEFQQEIDDEPNDRVKYQYTDNLIMAIRYMFTYNTQDIRKIQNFFFFRGSLETAGNLLYGGNSILGGKMDTLGNYMVFGVPYAQYVKSDFDLRFFNVISRNNSIAYRFYFGIGIPYGNAGLLPLEKGFYGGGANGMRGWPYRLLGPGSYSNPEDKFDRMGDVQLECNLEYRFPVYKFIKSALFADIGNIWLLNDVGAYTGGDFQVNRFYKEFAIDIGLGLRLDFNFFILRVDFAIPLRDPSMPEGERWIADKWQFNDFIVNFGIGYPF